LGFDKFLEVTLHAKLCKVETDNLLTRKTSLSSDSPLQTSTNTQATVAHETTSFDSCTTLDSHPAGCHESGIKQQMLRMPGVPPRWNERPLIQSSTSLPSTLSFRHPVNDLCAALLAFSDSIQVQATLSFGQHAALVFLSRSSCSSSMPP